MLGVCSVQCVVCSMYAVCSVIYADKELGRAGGDGWKFTESIVLPQFAAAHPVYITQTSHQWSFVHTLYNKF